LGKNVKMVEWNECNVVKEFDKKIDAVEFIYDVDLTDGYMETYNAGNLAEWRENMVKWLSGLIWGLSRMLTEVVNLDASEDTYIEEDS